MAELEALEPEWLDLWNRCPGATPFSNPAWLLPWWRRLWGGGKVCSVALREDGRLAGLAQMFLWGDPGRKCLSLAGSGISDYLDILVEPPHAAGGIEAILNWVDAHRGEWDLCDFQELRPGSVLAEAGAGRGMRAEPCAVCPVLELPATWDELAAGFSPKFRTDLRRARNRCSGAALETAAPANTEPLLEELFRLHGERWHERNEAGMLGTPALQAFHREAACGFSRQGLLRLYALRFETRIGAVLYGFAAHGRFYAYLDGFDPALAKLSPGTVLMSRAIESAIAEGLREFDFLRKPEGFKYLWGARDQVNTRLAQAA